MHLHDLEQALPASADGWVGDYHVPSRFFLLVGCNRQPPQRLRQRLARANARAVLRLATREKGLRPVLSEMIRHDASYGTPGRRNSGRQA
jgi:hypothetical protein